MLRLLWGLTEVDFEEQRSSRESRNDCGAAISTEGLGRSRSLDASWYGMGGGSGDVDQDTWDTEGLARSAGTNSLSLGSLEFLF